MSPRSLGGGNGWTDRLRILRMGQGVELISAACAGCAVQVFPSPGGPPILFTPI